MTHTDTRACTISQSPRFARKWFQPVELVQTDNFRMPYVRKWASRSWGILQHLETIFHLHRVKKRVLHAFVLAKLFQIFCVWFEWDGIKIWNLNIYRRYFVPVVTTTHVKFRILLKLLLNIYNWIIFVIWVCFVYNNVFFGVVELAYKHLFSFFIFFLRI